MSGRISPSVARASHREHVSVSQVLLPSTAPPVPLADDLRPLGRGRVGYGRGFGPVRSAGRSARTARTSPGGPRPTHGSPTLSPSVLGGAENPPAIAQTDAFLLPPAIAATGRAGASSSGTSLPSGRVSSPPPVPSAPPNTSSSTLLRAEAHVGLDESYGFDEQQLNSFLKVHPMLSLFVPATQTLTSQLPRMCLSIQRSHVFPPAQGGLQPQDHAARL